jgi:hypothetical protein
METLYVKQTVGPVLASALTSLVLQVPFEQNKSSFATTVDPINFIGQYLLDHVKKEKQTQELQQRLTKEQELIQNYKDAQQREKANRLKFTEDLVARVSVIKTKLDELEIVPVLEPVLEPLVEQVAVPEEPVPEPVKEPVPETTEEAPVVE